MYNNGAIVSTAVTLTCGLSSRDSWAQLGRGVTYHDECHQGCQTVLPAACWSAFSDPNITPKTLFCVHLSTLYTTVARSAFARMHSRSCRSVLTPLACMNSPQEVDSIVADLGQAGAMCHTTVISAPQGCGLGERYAALCSALSVGEKVRDQGGHSFVVLDDISCMVSDSCDTLCVYKWASDLCIFAAFLHCLRRLVTGGGPVRECDSQVERGYDTGDCCIADRVACSKSVTLTSTVMPCSDSELLQGGQSITAGFVLADCASLCQSYSVQRCTTGVTCIGALNRARPFIFPSVSGSRQYNTKPW